MDRNNRHNEHLGVNKMGKNIRKSPLHQPNFGNNNNNGGNNTAAAASAAARQQPQPHVYNISKNDFRNIVQQLTGSPSHEPLPTRPNNPPKPPSMRLQRIRPPPLAPVNRPPPVYPQALAPAPIHAAPPPVPAQVPYNNSVVRPGQFGQPSPTPWPPVTPVGTVWANTAESPISAYMRYLQNSIVDSAPRQPQAQQQYPQAQQQYPQAQQQFTQGPGQFYSQPLPSPGLLPNPSVPPLPLPSPRMNGAAMNSPGVFPSPTSQFLLPSPSGFLNLLSPRSPYPLLSPGAYPPLFTPNFPFSPQSGILGPGPQPPPPSPGILFPLSPSGFFPISSPRWRDQ